MQVERLPPPPLQERSAATQAQDALDALSLLPSPSPQRVLEPIPEGPHEGSDLPAPGGGIPASTAPLISPQPPLPFSAASQPQLMLAPALPQPPLQQATYLPGATAAATAGLDSSVQPQQAAAPGSTMQRSPSPGFRDAPAPMQADSGGAAPGRACMPPPPMRPPPACPPATAGAASSSGEQQPGSAHLQIYPQMDPAAGGRIATAAQRAGSGQAALPSAARPSAAGPSPKRRRLESGVPAPAQPPCSRMQLPAIAGLTVPQHMQEQLVQQKTCSVARSQGPLPQTQPQTLPQNLSLPRPPPVSAAQALTRILAPQALQQNVQQAPPQTQLHAAGPQPRQQPPPQQLNTEQELAALRAENARLAERAAMAAERMRAAATENAALVTLIEQLHERKEAFTLVPQEGDRGVRVGGDASAPTTPSSATCPPPHKRPRTSTGAELRPAVPMDVAEGQITAMQAAAQAAPEAEPATSPRLHMGLDDSGIRGRGSAGGEQDDGEAQAESIVAAALFINGGNPAAALLDILYHRRHIQENLLSQG